MRNYNGLIQAVSAPPMFLKRGVKVIVGNTIKTINRVDDGEDNSSIASSYIMEDDEKSYNYNDIKILVVEPMFNLGVEIQPWFENSVICMRQNTQTNWGYIIGDNYEYASKSSVQVYLLPEFWDEALKYAYTTDKIKFRVYKNKDDQNVPEFPNSRSIGYHAKII